MSLLPIEELRTELRFPRVSGDEPYLAMAAVLESAFSPRERG